MLDSKLTCQKWRELIQKAVGQKHVKRWREIVLDFLCVDCGLKPALLWDYATLSEESMEFLLTEAKKDNLLRNTLRLVMIESDMIVLKEDWSQDYVNWNIPNFDDKKKNNTLNGNNGREIIKGDNPENSHVKSKIQDGNDQQRFVDVTWTLTQPRLADLNLIQTTTQIFSSILQGASKVNVRDQNFNPTSLFGLLLGYPIVYWYDIDIDTGSNCLSYQPIRVFKLRGYLGESPMDNLGLKSHTVFSFSVPECVFGEIGNLVFEWKEQHVKDKKWELLFHDLQFEEEIKCLPTVCL